MDASAPDSEGVVFCKAFKWDTVLFILIENLVVSVPSTTADCNLFNNHRNRKVVGGKHNVLLLYLDVSTPCPSGGVLCNPFKRDILCSFLIKKSCCFLCACHKSKWILYLNQRNRKVVGGKQNVLVHYMDISAPDPFGIVLCNPFKWDILCSFLIKNHVVCVPTITAKCILFHNHEEIEVVGGTHNVLVHFLDAFAPDLAGVVICNPQHRYFSQHVIFPCQKVAFRDRLAQCTNNIWKKTIGQPSIYAYNQNTPTILGAFAILVVWWGGEQ